MARTGPKGKPPTLKVVSGTYQPCRRREPVVEAIPGMPVKPAWLKGRAAKLWAEKVETYRARGQAVAGCESALAQYCALEAALIDQYQKRMIPPVAQVNAFRILAAEFYDTPASQIVPTRQPGAAASKFSAHRQRPPRPGEGGGDA